MTTIASIVQSIADTLSAADSINGYQQVLETMQESIPDTPLVQVYPFSANGDSPVSFGRGFQGKTLIIRADVYITLRLHIYQDIPLMVTVLDELETILYGVTTKPYFGNVGIQGFDWTWEALEIQYAEATFVVARFTFNIKRDASQ